MANEKNPTPGQDRRSGTQKQPNQPDTKKQEQGRSDTGRTQDDGRRSRESRH